MRTRQHKKRTLDRFVRALVLGVGTLACLVMATHLDEIQSWEAQLTTMLLRPWTGGTSFSRRDVYFVPIGSTGIIGFQVTPECSVALMGLPLLIVSVIILQFPRVQWTCWCLGTAATAPIILVANQVRLLTVVAFTVSWAHNGYEIVGTVIGLAGFVAALLVLVGVTTRRREAAPTPERRRSWP
ncbi:exosortase/archaeosortase family protein [Leifsonia xyli]|nr:exosortase/archaeosortase family protein [Leifsonia xyli]